MKKITLVSLFLLLICGIMAQAPERFTYQAVVRNAANQLIINTNVGVRVSMLQGTATGNPVYVEIQTVSTNANGLLTLEIGGGTVQQGSFADIDWANGPFFLKTETDPNGGSNYTLTSTQQLLSVPYALYAKEAGNGFSGDYNDLTNTPTIPTVPTNVSAFINDASYLTTYTETDPTVPAWAKEANKPTYNYSEIANTPTIPTVPTNVSAFTNDAGYLSASQCPNVDICAMLNQMTLMQQQINTLQSRVDNLTYILDTSITHPVFTVTFMNGDSVHETMMIPAGLTYGQAIALLQNNTPVQIGREFQFWTNSATGTIPVSPCELITGDVFLYALFNVEVIVVMGAKRYAVTLQDRLNNNTITCRPMLVVPGIEQMVQREANTISDMGGFSFLVPSGYKVTSVRVFDADGMVFSPSYIDFFTHGLQTSSTDSTVVTNFIYNGLQYEGYVVYLGATTSPGRVAFTVEFDE